jgi:hypothetical protein
MNTANRKPARTALAITALTLLALAALAPLSAQAAIEPVPGSYSARLELDARRLRLFDPSGAVLDLSFEGCGESVRLPAGIWLLSRDQAGQPVLLAPSATALPRGHAGEVSVATCTDGADAAALRLPAALLQTLEDHASAIFVAE